MKHIAKVATMLKITIEEAIAYCEGVRRASGFGNQLSAATIARHLRGKKPPYPDPAVLAAIIRQEEAFRIRTGRRFPVHKSMRQQSSTKSSRAVLEKCPICQKLMKAKEIPEHRRLFHLKEMETSRTPLLDGIEVKSPELIRDLKRRVIDEQGFLVSADLIPETKMDSGQGRHFHPTGISKPLEQPNVFDKIKSLDSKIPGAGIKKLRPKANEQVLCPICLTHAAYRDLFNHVTKRHPEQNAKIVLAKFNREYEMLAKKKSSR